MVDEKKEIQQDKPSYSQGRVAKKEVDLFPALSENKRRVPIGAVRQTSRLGTEISIFAPVSFEEALDIVECLRSRSSTTISLENMKKLDANRLVDFVAGASAALDGDFHKLSEQVYLFCPSNIKITATNKQAGKGAASGFDGIGSLDFLLGGDKSSGGFGSTTWTN